MAPYQEGTFNEVSTATKEALEIYQKIEASKKNECEMCTDDTASSKIEEPLNTEVEEDDAEREPESIETALHVKEGVIENELKRRTKKMEFELYYYALFLVTGVIAGFIDAIAGGGGLLPFLFFWLRGCLHT